MAGPRTLTTDEEVSAAVDELLSSFGAPEGVEPDDTDFEEAASPRRPPQEKPTGAPSAEPEALWSAPKKKSKR